MMNLSSSFTLLIDTVPILVFSVLLPAEINVPVLYLPSSLISKKNDAVSGEVLLVTIDERTILPAVWPDDLSLV